MKSISLKVVLWCVISFLVIGAAGCQGQDAVSLVATQQPTSMPPVRALGGAVAEAAVVPLRHVALSFVNNGVVDELLVAEGDRVTEGEVIARLRGRERQQAAVTAAEAELISAKQALDDLYENHPKVKAQAELRLATAQKSLDDAFKNLENKKLRRGTREQIRMAQAEYILAKDRVERAEETYAGLGNRTESDLDRAAALTVLSNAQKVLDYAEAKLNNLQEKPSAYELGVAQAQYDMAKQEVEAAQRDLDKVKNGPDVEAVQLAKARIANAEAQLEAAKAGLADLELIAPFAAEVVSCDLKVGQQAIAGVSQVILADFSEWEVETTDLTELNVVNVKEGDAVTVNFDALPSVEVKGKVKRVQPLGKNVQGDITYKVTVALDQKVEALRWNMTATVVFED